MTPSADTTPDRTRRRARHGTDPTIAVIVDGRDGGEPLGRTLAALAPLVDDGVVQSVTAVATAPPPSGQAGRTIVAAADAAGASFTTALLDASAEVVVWITAGVEPHADAVRALVETLDHRHVAAVAGVVVDPVEGASPRPTGLSFVGHPLDATTGSAVGPDERTLFLGDVWAAWREDLDRVGGFDAALASPYLLLDLGWRLWLNASGIVVAPEVAFAGVTTAADPWALDATRRERDALITIYRNYDDASLGAALAAALVLSPARLAALDPSVDRDGGVQGYLAALDGLAPEREARQAMRLRPDAEIVGLLRDPLRPDCPDPAFVERHASVVGALPGGHRFGGRHRIVVATRDSLAPRMAGPGIRAWNVARELSREHDVRLVSLTKADLTDPHFSIELTHEREIEDLVEWCDIFVFQGWVMAGQECFEREDRIFVVDVYDPMHLEQLEQGKDEGEDARRRHVAGATAILNDQLARGDFFLCASDKQRDFWLGSLASLGRINSATYDDDPSLRSHIAVVPFGIPDEPAVRTRDAIKGVMPGVGADDPVILWGGGVYNWFDPLTLIRAVDRLRERIPGVKLVFLGMRHPNAEVPEMRMAVDARELAASLGLVGSTVIFNEQWVAYEDRQNYLLDADVAVTTHLHHIETEFSFRTRVLDYLWAGLPIVATGGDALADLIHQERLGIAVPPNDIDALEAALFRLLDDKVFADECRERVQAVQPAFAWSVALRPVVEFCRAPQRAPDLVADFVDTRGSFELVKAGPPSAFTRYKQVVVSLIEAGEWRLTLSKAKRVGLRTVKGRLRR